MPKILCKCGEVFEDISIPNPNGYFLISENALDRIETEEKAGPVSRVFDRLTEEGIQVFRCPGCGRLIVFADGRGLAPKTYQED